MTTRHPTSSRPRGRPRKDAPDRPTADGILDAAERLFADQGFGNTSLRGLIEASRMSTTAFYARFESKDAVLAALVERLMTSIGEAFLATMPQARDVAEGFDAGVDMLVDALARNRFVVRVALGEGAASEPVRETLLAGYQELASLLGKRLAQGNGAGRRDEEDAETLAWALVGALQMQVMRWAVFDEIDDQDLRDALRTTAHALVPAELH
jgi:AcrR family transcriptional regulator